MLKMTVFRTHLGDMDQYFALIWAQMWWECHHFWRLQLQVTDVLPAHVVGRSSEVC